MSDHETHPVEPPDPGDPPPPEEEARLPEHRPYPDPGHSITPRKPRTVGGVVYLVVLAAALGGLAVVALGPWRTGLGIIGASMVAGGLARLVIPDDRAGMLGIRRKFIDVATLLALGGALLALAAVIPDRTPV